MYRTLQIKQKPTFILGILLFIIVSLATTAQLMDFSTTPEPLTLSELSPATRRGIEEEAVRHSLSVEEFIAKYVVSTKSVEEEINKGLWIGLFFICIFPLYYHMLMAGTVRLGALKTSTQLGNDEIRMGHLHILQKKIIDFFGENKRYPSEDEYVGLLNSIEEDLTDPQYGKSVSGRDKARYGYYYDQYNPKSQKSEQTYYHLWCFLENGIKYELTSSDRGSKK